MRNLTEYHVCQDCHRPWIWKLRFDDGDCGEESVQYALKAHRKATAQRCEECLDEMFRQPEMHVRERYEQ